MRINIDILPFKIEKSLIFQKVSFLIKQMEELEEFQVFNNTNPRIFQKSVEPFEKFYLCLTKNYKVKCIFFDKDKDPENNFHIKKSETFYYHLKRKIRKRNSPFFSLHFYCKSNDKYMCIVMENLCIIFHTALSEISCFHKILQKFKCNKYLVSGKNDKKILSSFFSFRKTNIKKIDDILAIKQFLKEKAFKTEISNPYEIIGKEDRKDAIIIINKYAQNQNYDFSFDDTEFTFSSFIAIAIHPLFTFYIRRHYFPRKSFLDSSFLEEDLYKRNMNDYYRLHEFQMDEFCILHIIENSSETCIKCALHLKSERLVALKMFHDEAAFKKELKFYCLLHHKAILPFYGIIHDENNNILVLQFMSKGSLSNCLNLMTNEQKNNAIIDIIYAIDYIHSQGVIHRDIKAENILLDADFNSYLSDFNLSHIVKKGKEKITNSSKNFYAGTYGFIPPEILNNECFSFQSDLYSFGILIYQIVTNELPFNDLSEITELTQKGDLLPLDCLNYGAILKIYNICKSLNMNGRSSSYYLLSMIKNYNNLIFSLKNKISINHLMLLEKYHCELSNDRPDIRALNLNDIESLFFYGRYIQKGFIKGNKISYQMAFKIASNAGHIGAKYKLGRYYYKVCRFLYRNFKEYNYEKFSMIMEEKKYLIKAFKYLKESADLNHAKAMFYLFKIIAFLFINNMKNEITLIQNTFEIPSRWRVMSIKFQWKKSKNISQFKKIIKQFFISQYALNILISASAFGCSAAQTQLGYNFIYYSLKNKERMIYLYEYGKKLLTNAVIANPNDKSISCLVQEFNDLLSSYEFQNDGNLRNLLIYYLEHKNSLDYQNLQSKNNFQGEILKIEIRYNEKHQETGFFPYQQPKFPEIKYKESVGHVHIILNEITQESQIQGNSTNQDHRSALNLKKLVFYYNSGDIESARKFVKNLNYYQNSDLEYFRIFFSKHLYIHLALQYMFDPDSFYSNYKKYFLGYRPYWKVGYMIAFIFLKKYNKDDTSTLNNGLKAIKLLKCIIKEKENAKKALSLLGQQYWEGRVVPQNYEIALSYLLLTDFGPSPFYKAQMYERGIVVQKSLNKAIYFYKMIADNCFYPEASQKLQELAPSLNFYQLNECANSSKNRNQECIRAYHCYTCGIFFLRVICSYCAMNCHASHDIMEVGFRNMKCSCHKHVGNNNK